MLYVNFFHVLLITSLCCKYNYYHLPSEEPEVQEKNSPKATQLRSSSEGNPTQAYLSPETVYLLYHKVNINTKGKC